MQRIPIIGIWTSGLATTIFLDTTEISGDSLRIVKQNIQQNIRFVENIWVDESIIEGFAIDQRALPIQLFGERVVILRESAFKSIIKGIIESVKIAPQIVLYVMGREMGEQYYLRHSEVMGEDKEKLAKVAEQLFAAIGLGIPEKIKLDLNKPEIEYKIYDNVECKINLELGRRVNSALIRGIIEGYYSKLLGMNAVSYTHLTLPTNREV